MEPLALGPYRFPKSTKLVVGPGFINHFTPGWPRNPEGVLLDCDIEYVPHNIYPR